MKSTMALAAFALCLAACHAETGSPPGQVLQSFRPLPVDFPAQDFEPAPTTIRVYLDRAVYTDRDRDGQGLVVINPPSLLYGGKLQGHRARAWLEGVGGKPIGEPAEAAVGDSDHFAFDLDVPGIATGSYSVVATLVDPRGREVARGSRSFSKEKDNSPPPAKTAEVPLVLFRDASLVNFSALPVSAGIPVPDGMLDDTARVSLTENGAEIPCQAAARARWTKKGTVKWLGLDFQAAYENGEPKKYVLQLGKAPTAMPAKPVIVRETPESYVLENGVLQVAVGRKTFRLFDHVVFDRNTNGQFEAGETIVKAIATDGPYWINAEGKAFRAALDKAPEVRVEESGPLRTTLRADGWLTAEDGAKAGRYTTRISLYAGKPQVGVNQHYVITWDTLERAMRVKDLGVSITPLGLRKTQLALYNPAVDLPERDTFYMLADRWNRVLVGETGTGKVHYARGGETLRYDRVNFLNSRWPLWFGAFGSNGGVAVHQRYMAEKFPKEIEVGRNTLAWHAWPMHGTETWTTGTDLSDFVNMRWLHQGKYLDFQVPAEYLEALDGFRALSPNVRVTMLVPADRKYSGSGTAISGELMYYFVPETNDVNAFNAQVGPMAFAFDAAPHAIADPVWAAGAKTLEFITPPAPQYPDIEKGVSRYFDAAMVITEDGREYGQFVWPNGHDYYSPGWDFGSFHRSRVNTHHGTEMPGWILYLRSGEKKYWHYARSFSRYLMDHASANWDPYDPKVDRKPQWGAWPGSAYHCQGYVPWSPSEPELLGHMSPQWHAILYYYMTGDSQALDLAKATATSVLKDVRVASNFDVRGPYKGLLNRNPVCGWAMVAGLYTELLDPRLMRPVLDIGEQIFNGKPDAMAMDGAPPQGQSGRWWWYAYNQQWRDPAAIEAVADLGKGGISFAGYMVNRAEVTGDTEGIYSFWHETLGCAPLRQFAMGHPDRFVNRESMADNINFILPLAGAMAKLGLPETPCLVPAGYDPKSTVVFREESDRAFDIRFWGYGQEHAAKYKPVPYAVEGPDGKTVVTGMIDRAKMGMSPGKAVVVTIPADGKTGDYVLRLAPQDVPIRLTAPMSDLAKEVYIVPAGRTFTGTTFYWRTLPGEKERTLAPLLRYGENYSTLFRLETPQGYTVRESSDALPIHLQLQPDTMYRLTMCVGGTTSYSWRWKTVWPASVNLSPGPDMVISADESRWFRPVAK